MKKECDHVAHATKWNQIRSRYVIIAILIVLALTSVIWSICKIRSFVIYTSYPINDRVHVKIATGRFFPEERFIAYPKKYDDRVRFDGSELHVDDKRIRYPFGYNCYVLKSDLSSEYIIVNGVPDVTWKYTKIFDIEQEWAAVGRRPIMKIDDDGERMIASMYPPPE